MFKLAHITDPHLPVPKPQLAELLLQPKRGLSYWAWVRKKRSQHDKAILDQLTDRIQQHKPDHLVVTGDLIQISTPAEFAAAKHWLRQLGPPDNITVIPGNHDAHVAVPWKQGLGLWADYMPHEGDEEFTSPGPARNWTDFPRLRTFGNIALISLNTARPTAIGLATGELGTRQLQNLETLLSDCHTRGQCRIILLHHPPVPGTTSLRKALKLRDAERLGALLARTGAELILHGHEHEFFDYTIAGPTGPIPAWGLPSASANGTDKGRPHAHFALYAIDHQNGNWQIEQQIFDFSGIAIPR